LKWTIVVVFIFVVYDLLTELYWVLPHQVKRKQALLESNLPGITWCPK